MHNLLKRVFLLLAVAVASGCLHEPEVAPIPHIEFSDIYFVKPVGTDPVESLVLSISYEDRDGDLGLSSDDIDVPYHRLYYGVTHKGATMEVATKTLVSHLPQFIHLPYPIVGKLITTRTTQDPVYAHQLPPYIGETESCKNYRWEKVYIQEADKNIIDKTYPFIDTVFYSSPPFHWRQSG